MFQPEEMLVYHFDRYALVLPFYAPFQPSQHCARKEIHIRIVLQVQWRGGGGTSGDRIQVRWRWHSRINV